MEPLNTASSLSEVRSIAIFRALQLGDLLCTIPAIRTLRNACPQARISLIGLPGMRELAGRYPRYIDEFISFPGYPGLPEQAFDQTAFDTFSICMKQRRFDLILQMQGNGSIVNDMLRGLSPVRLGGFCQSDTEQNEWMMKYPDHGHEITRHLALMAHLGIENRTGTALEFPILEQDIADLRKSGFGLPEKSYVCVHPGSRGSWRQWPPQHFAALADSCAREGYYVVITGTEGERELALEVAAHMQDEPIILSGKTSLGGVAALISRAHLLIANCTGVSHLAAALRIPSVVISMDGAPERWGPLDKYLHRTVDWTKTPDDGRVLSEVRSFL